jgi:hypothetical protein
MACNVPRQVGATYKGLWTRVKKNAEARRFGYTKKRYKGLDQPPKYVSPTLTYNYHRDYSIKDQQPVSILTLAGRVIVPYQGYSIHIALLQVGATIGAAKLWYDRSRRRFYLLVSLEVETPDPTPDAYGQVLGGRRGPAVSRNCGNNHQQHAVLQRKAGESQSRPLCAPQQEASAKRHSFGYQETRSLQWTRETVEAEYQP